MDFKQSIIGSSIAFLIATSCCWLPALIIALGGASGLMAFSNRLEQYSGLFMATGAVFLLYGGIQFSKKKPQLCNQMTFNYSPLLLVQIVSIKKKKQCPPMPVSFFTNVKIVKLC